MESTKSRLGLSLFLVYLVLYGAFVLLNAFAPQTMEYTPIAGVNLAILYGFGLIIAALVLALIYGFFSETAKNSSKPASDLDDQQQAASGGMERDE